MGSKEHKANMEKMTEDVRTCLLQGSFGSRPLHAYRGIKPCDFVFVDDEQLHNFLDLNEEGKMEFSPVKYAPSQNEILDTLHVVWKVDKKFEGDYIKDYKALRNDTELDVRTSWIDKYTTSLYSYSVSEDVKCRRYEVQPIPDFLRWYKTGELPLEERALLGTIFLQPTYHHEY